jgi:hypothetical protein
VEAARLSGDERVMGGGERPGRFCDAGRTLAQAQAGFTTERAEHKEKAIDGASREAVKSAFSVCSARSVVNLAVFRFVPGAARLVS